MTTATTRQPMSKADATRFNRYSPENAGKVLATLQCGCQPYQDVFTYKRWRALGHQVQRGQKAIQIPVIIESENEDGDKTKRFWRSSVFCRHQVQPIDGDKTTSTPTPEPVKRPLVNPHATAIKQDSQQIAQERFDKQENIMEGWKLL